MANPTSLEEFIASHSDAELLPTVGNLPAKLKCTSTGHELLARLDVAQQYWTGSKYATAKARATYDFTQHEPWIVAHKKDPHLLYCSLTRQPVCKLPKAVQGHVQGKRYKRLLKEAKEGKPKPTGKRQEKLRQREGAKGDGDTAGDKEGAAGEEEDKDDDDVDDDAAEFLAEGAFWEKEGEEDDDEEEDEDEDEDDDGARRRAAEDDDDEDAFWTRPKILVAGGKKAKKKAAKLLKKSGAEEAKEEEEEEEDYEEVAEEEVARPPAKVRGGKDRPADAKRKIRPEERRSGAPPVKATKRVRS